MKVQQTIHSVATYVAARHKVTVVATASTPVNLCGAFTGAELTRRQGVIVCNPSATNRIYIMPRNKQEDGPSSSVLTSSTGMVHILEPLMDRPFEYDENVNLWAVADSSTDVTCLPYFE